MHQRERSGSVDRVKSKKLKERVLDHLLYGGEQNPPPDEWIDFVLQTSVYSGLHPDEIDDLPAEKVQTDLLMYQISQERAGR